jgi:hypothetical protein
MMPQVAMADPTVVNATDLTITIDGTSLTIESTKAGALKSFMDANSDSNIPTMKACTSLVFVNKFNSDDLRAVAYDKGFTAVTSVDMSEAKFTKKYDSSTPPSSYLRYDVVGSLPSGSPENPYVIVGGDVKRWTATRSWTSVGRQETYTEYATVAARDAATYTATVNSYARIPADKYCQLNITTLNAGPTITTNEPSSFTYNSGGGSDLDNNGNINTTLINSEMSGLSEWQTYCFTRYYKWVEESGVKKWVICDKTVYDDTSVTDYEAIQCPDYANINALDAENYGHAGSVMRVYVYYTKTFSKSWVEESVENPHSDSPTPLTADDYIYEERNSNLWRYGIEDDGKWVKMTDYNYYQLTETGSGTWGNVPSPIVPIEVSKYFENSEAVTNGTVTGEYAVVGGTFKIYNGSAWVDASTLPEIDDYTQMQFGYWGPTLTTVKLPANLKASECADIFTGPSLGSFAPYCGSVTSVESGGITATIDRSATPNATITTPDDAGFERLRGILLLNYFANAKRLRNILDLRGISVSDITIPYLNGLTNPDLEYILLPKGVDKNVIFNANYDDLTGLKAVISSDEDTDPDTDRKLVAYVKVPGSLAEARCLVTDNTSSENFYPKKVGLTSVCLGGNLYLDDIKTESTKSLREEQETITSLDLENAVFINPSTGEIDCSQMTISSAGFGNAPQKLTHIELPTNPQMNTIPENCLQNVKKLKNLCIPYNYEYILSGAFVGTGIDHITTTDDFEGAVIDNGEKTYTFSANLKQLGSTPSLLVDPDTGEPNSTYPVFEKEMGVREIYPLATKVPICYKGVFDADMCEGYGGPDQTKVYCREKYFNEGNELKAFGVLRYPSKESYDNAPASLKEPDGVDPSLGEQALAGDKVTDGYQKMVMKYVDPYRDYTKKDQTGAVDADGEPIIWPTYTEAMRSYGQAGKNFVWDDQTKLYTGAGMEFITDGGDDIHQTNEKHYSFAEYAGWHQIVLTQATYVEPKEKEVENKKAVHSYVQGGWYTFCIPFDMTEEQVYAMLGVPYSDDLYINKIKEIEGDNEVVKEVVTSSEIVGEGTGIGKSNRVLPDIRTLKGVTRRPGSTNEVHFLLTKNLAPGGEYLNISETFEDGDADGDGTQNEFISQTVDYTTCGTNGKGEKILIKGGYPYLIRPYFYLQGDESTASDKNVNNLGKYVMTRFGDKFSQTASCVHKDRTVEPIGGGGLTLEFAKPFEHHKILAVLDNGSKGTEFAAHANGKRYYYTFIGQFWEQQLPLYSFYMVGGSWYRYSSGKNRDKYKWFPYNCIIMATQEINDSHTTSGKYRDNSDGHSFYPTIREKTNDLLDDFLRLEFLDGLDDAVFDPKNAARGYRFTFDDDIMEIGEDSETTFISNLDGKDIQPTSTNSRIYNIAGQYVSNSLEGLSKGMYIVNGKKIVVK